MKKLFLYIILTVIFISVVGFYGKDQFRGSQNNQLEKTAKKADETISFKNIDVSVEIADTDEERRTGLSGRERLGEGEGMLFKFDEIDTERTFWMKDMKFPIDIIWINDNQVLKIDENLPIPPKDTPDTNLIRYSSGAPVDYVLEVTAGFCDKHRIEPGDKLEINI